MDFPFLVLVFSFVLSFANAGAAGAHAALAPDQPAFRGNGWLGAGGVSLLALTASVVAVFVPAFDVNPPALIAAAVLASLATLAGLKTGMTWTLLRGALWLATAAVQASAMIQAVGLT